MTEAQPHAPKKKNCLRSLFQLRYLQTLNTISAEKNSTIIFPVPMDIISHFFAGNKKEN